MTQLVVLSLLLVLLLLGLIPQETVCGARDRAR
jgi:hypothetical protein